MRPQPLDFSPDNRTGAVLLARLYSNVISPPAVFGAAGLIVAWLDSPDLTTLLLGALYGILASLLPVLFVVYLYKKGKVSDIHMSNKNERYIPYLIGLVGALIAYLLVGAWADAPLLQSLILTHIAVMIALAVFNYIQLFSAHVATVTALTIYAGFTFGFLASIYLSPLIIITFYIRRFLKRHTYVELVGGFLLGVGSTFLIAAFGAFR